MTKNVNRLQQGQFCLLLLGLGLALFAGTALQEFMILPSSFDSVGLWIYRFAFVIAFPFRMLMVYVIPPVNHQFSLTHVMVSSFGAPWFLWIVWRLEKYLQNTIRRWGAGRLDEPPEDEGRRSFLVRSTWGALGAAVGGGVCYAMAEESENIQIRHFEFPMEGLPDALDGLKLIHISDTHYGPYASARYLNSMVEQANSLHGDIIVLTGDYVHLTPRSIPEGIRLLSSLKGRLGRVAVLGNHDHWRGAAACREGFRDIDIPLVDNNRLFVTPEGLSERPKTDEAICIGGVGDLWTDRVSPAKAFQGVPSSVPRVLLSHNPDVAEYLDPRLRVDLMLSGHTHGGQVLLPLIGPIEYTTAFGEKYLGGLCKGPHCPVIVSRGVGFTRIPLRFRVPPEISVIILKKPNNAHAAS